MTMTPAILQELTEETERQGFILFSLFASFAPVHASEPDV